ncbi:cadherin-related family member 5 isoform X1 [Takifugu flavidus]|uniref:Fat-like cadherin-related tumor suppressor-like protein n=1 Tax=Takifugu flavidus TaxID=433684 RepID=A0A5C6PA72_9TELE|nr:cadherin-related family member 5 isoform X1 [Takifugu flavidus]XP_056907527.1 cadherin-related family member 5 isoform X1 [Takifugu flavidus]TWW76393.1 Fat-like cadherin-related tumor suppressor -like protein [Takifugu flavidus]
MALTETKSSISKAKVLVCLLAAFWCLRTAAGMSGWGGCMDGQDVYGSIRENSRYGDVVAELMVEPMVEGIWWSLDGKDADWFFLEDSSIRLNASAEKVLDREAQGPILMASLRCHENDMIQSTYRIMVEILNANDNFPVFEDRAELTVPLSELTPVDTVVFSVQANDPDNDKIIYSIDQTSPDAEYFKIELPNSGEVILSKPLDYEAKNQLAVTIHASEMYTEEHFNTSTNVSIIVLDGDDQYPQFLPCMLLFEDETRRICTSPVYTVNVTEGEEDIVLDFSPGPIHAVDGDSGLRSPISYAILSGDDDGRFRLDGETGEMRLTRGVSDRLTTPRLHLNIMAYQVDDPRKYTVATVLVRVLAVNHFHPEFQNAEYRGFVSTGKTGASLVNTYGGKVLKLHVQDGDFNHDSNPMIHFSFTLTSNYTSIYRITQEGLLIAKTNKLKPSQKHVLEVMAVDQESGDAAFAIVVVEVLAEGQLVPYSALAEERKFSCTLGKALFLCTVFLTILGCIVSMVMWLKKKHRGKRDPLERGCVAQGKHPNVSLRWFQLSNHRNTMAHVGETLYDGEYGTCNPSFSFPETPGMYTLHDLPPGPGSEPPRMTATPEIHTTAMETVHNPTDNVSAPNKHPCSPPSSHSATVKVRRPPPPPGEKAASSPDSEAPPNTSPDSMPFVPERTPCTSLDSEPTEITPDDDLIDPVTSPSSQSSIPWSRTRIAAAEIEKPLCKPSMKTSPESPHQPSPLPRQLCTPPSTPDHSPLKATLIHIDMSSIDTPLATPKLTSISLSVEMGEFSTSLDERDQSEPETGGAGSPTQDRRPSTLSVNPQDVCEAEGTAGDGFLGDEVGDKRDEGEDDFEMEDEALLRALMRCNPYLLTFSK